MSVTATHGMSQTIVVGLGGTTPASGNDIMCEWARSVRTVYWDHQHKENALFRETHLGDANPVPAVHLEVGILPLLERNPRWPCVAFLEGRFVSWDSLDPEREMIPWFDHGIRSVRTIR